MKKLGDKINNIGMIIYIIAALSLIYGLWVHSFTWIFGGIIMAALGYFISYLTKG